MTPDERIAELEKQLAVAAAATKIAAVAPPTTTRAEDDKAKGQRSTSMMWEVCHALIVAGSCLTTFWVAATEVLRNGPNADACLALIGTLSASIIHSYLTRTNHQKVGGVGGESAGTR